MADPFSITSLQGLALVAPDTSPHTTENSHEDDDWDLGSGAGFWDRPILIDQETSDPFLQLLR